MEIRTTKRTETPYIGEIQSLWGKASGEMNLVVKWFYHPSELEVKTALPKHKVLLDYHKLQVYTHLCACYIYL